jgi:cold shock protein
MAILATIRRWNTHRAWGVLDSPETPGGCWAHLSNIARPGPWDIQPGDEYMLEWEHAQQDGFAYRAVRMWPAGTAPIDPVIRHNSSAYSSSLTLTFDED